MVESVLQNFHAGACRSGVRCATSGGSASWSCALVLSCEKSGVASLADTLLPKFLLDGVTISMIGCECTGDGCGFADTRADGSADRCRYLLRWQAEARLRPAKIFGLCDANLGSLCRGRMGDVGGGCQQLWISLSQVCCFLGTAESEPAKIALRNEGQAARDLV